MHPDPCFCKLGLAPRFDRLGSAFGLLLEPFLGLEGRETKAECCLIFEETWRKSPDKLYRVSMIQVDLPSNLGWMFVLDICVACQEYCSVLKLPAGG